MFCFLWQGAAAAYSWPLQCHICINEIQRQKFKYQICVYLAECLWDWSCLKFLEFISWLIGQHHNCGRISDHWSVIGPDICQHNELETPLEMKSEWFSLHLLHLQSILHVYFPLLCSCIACELVVVFTVHHLNILWPSEQKTKQKSSGDM